MIAGAGAAVTLGALALFFGALLSIVRSDLTGGKVLVWLAFALLAPYLGSLLWFLIGRRNAERRPGIA
ncbi:PLDc N-terminal domain-containing protein [Streptomyces sp. NPDC001118]|uniref:PLDc N-terminal domain-containing protein n=1 Tax=Streptomyces sp. NPDC002589 TaxID=3154420 RepID=UPI003317372D